MKSFACLALSGLLCLTTLGASAQDIVIDNGGAGFTTAGSWTASTFDAGYHGTNYLHDGSAAADSGKSATWTPTIPGATAPAARSRTRSCNPGTAAPGPTSQALR